MCNNKEITDAKVFEELYQFGAKCYKKGYRKACLEVWAGIGISATIILGLSILEKLFNSGD